MEVVLSDVLSISMPKEQSSEAYLKGNSWATAAIGRIISPIASELFNNSFVTQYIGEMERGEWR